MQNEKLRIDGLSESVDLTMNEDEKDTLQEIFNIAIGSASAVIAEMMDVFVNMHVPEADIIDVAGLKKYVDNLVNPENNYFISSQIFNGGFNGESLMFCDYESTGNLVRHLEGTYSDVVAYDVFLELSNIVTTGFIKKIGELLESDFSFSQPSVDLRKGSSLVEFSGNDLNAKVIIANMVIDLDKINLNGYFFLLTKTSSFIDLKNAISGYLEDLMSD